MFLSLSLNGDVAGFTRYTSYYRSGVNVGFILTIFVESDVQIV